MYRNGKLIPGHVASTVTPASPTVRPYVCQRTVEVDGRTSDGF